MDNGSETLSLVDLTQKLLDAIAKKDWETYLSLCDDKMSCIEPETYNSYYEGLDFHKTYFDLPDGDNNISIKENILQPTIKSFGDIAIICYKRITQVTDNSTNNVTRKISSETRVWRRVDSTYRLVHYHRS
jgi:hypothetical protein